MMIDEGITISVRNVSKIFHPPVKGILRRLLRPVHGRTVTALRNVSLDIPRGEIFGLVGRNGQGKTTLIRCIASLLSPTGGTLRVNGYDTNRQSEKVKALIGLVAADERTFYGRLTGRQNLLFFARLYGLDEARARQRIGALVEIFKFGALLDRRFQELSSGNKQRMSLIRALLIDPPVILLDEPTRSLDPIAADELRGIIHDYLNLEQGKTIFITSHNLNEIETLCARVGFLSRGEIKLCATMDELSQRYFCIEKVSLSVRGMSAGDRLESIAYDPLALEWRAESSGLIKVSFQRKSGDDLLNAVIAQILARGGSIVGCSVERDGLRQLMNTIEAENQNAPDLAPIVPGPPEVICDIGLNGK